MLFVFDDLGMQKSRDKICLFHLWVKIETTLIAKVFYSRKLPDLKNNFCLIETYNNSHMTNVVWLLTIS